MTVSIIIPAYNAEDYIDRCLDSILKDNYFEGLEVICVDDGSTDKTLERLNSYSNNAGALKIISQDNGGVSSARNHGLEVAQGDYVMFVDADDYVSPDTLHEIFTHIEERYNDADWFIMGYNRTSRNGTFTIDELTEHVYSPKCFCDMINMLGSNLFGSPCNKIYRKEIIDNAGLRFDTEMHISEDAKFNYGYIRECKKIVTLSSVYYNYEVNLGSATAKYRGETFWEDMPKYRNAGLQYIEYAKSLGTTEESISRSIYSLNDINAFQTLFAIYSIYRAKNRPKRKYRVLKNFISKYNEIIGIDMREFYHSGVPKLFGISVNLHPYLGHLLLKTVFTAERVKNRIKR